MDWTDGGCVCVPHPSYVGWKVVVVVAEGDGRHAVERPLVWNWCPGCLCVPE